MVWEENPKLERIVEPPFSMVKGLKRSEQIEDLTGGEEIEVLTCAKNQLMLESPKHHNPNPLYIDLQNP